MNHDNSTTSGQGFDNLRAAILGRVDEERVTGSHPPPRHTMMRLGSLLEASLININYLREDLARELDVEPEFVNALIDGQLPEADISDDLLVEIAHAIGYEPNLLRIALSREILPYQDHMMANSELSGQNDYLFITQPEELMTQQNNSHPSGRLYYCDNTNCPGHESFSAQCKPAPREVSMLQQYELAYEAAIGQAESPEENTLQQALEKAYDEQQQLIQQLRAEVEHLQQELNQLREVQNSQPQLALFDTIADYQKRLLSVELSAKANQVK